MGLLSKAVTLIKEEQRKAEVAKKLTTATVKPTVVKTNATLNTAKPQTIRPMVTPNITNSKMPDRTVSTIKLSTLNQTANQTPTTRVAQVNQKPATSVQPNVQAQQQLRQKTKTVMEFDLFDKPELDPNRHRSSLIPVSYKAVHPTLKQEVSKPNIANTVNVVASYRNQMPQQVQVASNQTNPRMNTNMNARMATRMTSSPVMMSNQQSSGPVTPTTRPTAMTRPATYSSATSSMPRPTSTTMVRPNSAVRPNTTTRPNPAINTTTAPRPASTLNTKKIKTKRNRVVIKKRTLLKIGKLVSALALAFTIQLGTLNFINLLETNAIELPTFNPEKFFPQTTEQVATKMEKIEAAKKIKQNVKNIQEQNATTTATTKQASIQQLPSQTQQQSKQTVALAKTPHNAIIEKSIQAFTQGLQSKFTQRDREVFAKMIYGEAGYGIDPFEVGHVALNRLASGRFGKTLTEVITAKRQFDGFSEKHPIDKDCLAIANQLIAEFEANGCKAFCDYYYFYTHPEKYNKETGKFQAKYNRNKFKKNIMWEKPVLPDLPGYSEEYCAKATEQAAHYHAQRNKEKAATHIAALTR